MALHVSFIALLIVTVTHYSVGGPVPASGRREQDIIIYKPKKNVIGPAYGHSVYGGQEIDNSPRPPPTPPPPMERESSEVFEEDYSNGEFDMGRRKMDTHINTPQSYAPYGQQFYQGDNVHNAPVAYAVMGSGFGRRNQDIIIYRPATNIVGPPYAESLYGEQVINNSRPVEGGYRRSADSGLAPGRRYQDIIVYRPYTNIVGPPYGKSVYGGQSIYNGGSGVPDKEIPA